MTEHTAIIEDDDLLEDQADEPVSEEEAESITEYGKLFEADAGNLDVSARRALTALLAKPSISNAGEPDLYRLVLQHESELHQNLNNLGLVLTVSQRYGVAWASQAPMEGASPLYVLKRQMRLRRDQTVLLVFLRVRQHAAETRGDETWYCEAEELVDEAMNALYASTKDQAAARQALQRALDDLENMGYVKTVSAEEGRLRIMPLLPASIPLERALAMTDELNALAGEAGEA